MYCSVCAQYHIWRYTVQVQSPVQILYCTLYCRVPEACSIPKNSTRYNTEQYCSSEHKAQLVEARWVSRTLFQGLSLHVEILYPCQSCRGVSPAMLPTIRANRVYDYPSNHHLHHQQMVPIRSFARKDHETCLSRLPYQRTDAPRAPRSLSMLFFKEAMREGMILVDSGRK